MADALYKKAILKARLQYKNHERQIMALLPSIDLARKIAIDWPSFGTVDIFEPYGAYCIFIDINVELEKEQPLGDLIAYLDGLSEYGITHKWDGKLDNNSNAMTITLYHQACTHMRLWVNYGQSCKQVMVGVKTVHEWICNDKK